MLRRSILQFASRGLVYRVPLRATTQIPSFLSSRRAFSVSQKNGPNKHGPGSSAPEQQSQFPKILTGGLALGSVFLAAYYYGFLDTYLGKDQESIPQYAKTQIPDRRMDKSHEQLNAHYQANELSERPASRESDVPASDANHCKQDEIHSGLSVPQDSIRNIGENNQSKDTEALTQENVEGADVPFVPQISHPSENVVSVEGSGIPVDSESSQPSDDISRNKPADENFDVNDTGLKTDVEKSEASEITSTSSIDNGSKPVQTEHPAFHGVQEVEDGTKKNISLLDDYLLRDKLNKSSTSDSSKVKDLSSIIEHSDGGFITKDGKLVLDFLQAIHAAEERQAELDARSFSEVKRAIKEKYEKELKDARVRELMYAEREAILEKELNKEKVKAGAALKSLQEKLEEKRKTELEQKEMEVEQQLKKMQEMAKAELAAAIASEKASQIEKMAEANLHINALCMAFFARSEEARQNHSVHKLALGALSLEDTLSKGLPIQKDIEALHTHIEGIDNDSLIALVLSSLPEDTRRHGTDTLSELNHKFDGLKGTLRRLSFIPPGGGGILTHSLAHVASWLKVKEVDESGDGIESLINRVENLLAQGKLCEAADTLENGVKGSKAAEVVDEWVRRARHRAITEQALTVLQSYATSISLT